LIRRPALLVFFAFATGIFGAYVLHERGTIAWVFLLVILWFFLGCMRKPQEFDGGEVVRIMMIALVVFLLGFARQWFFYYELLEHRQCFN